MELNQIFYEKDYSKAFDFIQNNAGTTIQEIEADTIGRRFQIITMPALTTQQQAEQEIWEIKEKLAKYKEDVEQVELFGMERADYEEKKQLCANMIVRLRELEKIVKSN